ncbi:MAG: hypothetical protein J2P34_06110 [Actinobacteria bacterium]|nr:hypothetical protein [Actinomycetota bacterium]
MSEYQAPAGVSPRQYRRAPAYPPCQGGQETTAMAQAQAILALAREVSQVKAELAEVHAALSSIYEALDSIERTIDPPRYR